MLGLKLWMLWLSAPNTLLRGHICMLKCHHPYSDEDQDWNSIQSLTGVLQEAKLAMQRRSALPLAVQSPSIVSPTLVKLLPSHFWVKNILQEVTNAVGGGRREGVFLPSPHADRVCQSPGPAWPRKKEHTIRDRATRICLFHLCPKLYHLRPAAGWQCKSSPESDDK